MAERDLFDQPAVATAPPDAKKKGEYRTRAAYFTPDLLALRICERLAQKGVQPRRVLEPGCGGGAFLRAAHQVWPTAKLLGIDLVPCCDGPGEIRTEDFFEFKPIEAFDLVLGNPPFDIAEKFIWYAIAAARPGGYVAFLLRMALAAGVRNGLHETHPLWRLDPVIPRPSFTGGGSDKAQEYAVLTWKRGHLGEFAGQRLVWKEGRRK